MGSKREAVTALRLAGWYPADAITLATSVEIAGSVLFDRPFREAPVSPLFYDGRKQDLAFEKPVGESADRRNHVRFWLVLEKGSEGRPVWLGSATFDRGVGLSRYTGEITHHIGADVDAVRDLLIADLTKAHMLTEAFQVSGIGVTLNGRNGGGDPYYTDGEITVGVLSANAEAQTAAPEILPNPPAVAVKNVVWAKVKHLFRRVEP